jgi:cytochrome P450
VRQTKSDWTWFRGSFKEVSETLASRGVCPVRPDSEPFLGRTLLVFHGKAHADRRRLESALFDKEALRSYELDILSPILESTFEELGEVGRDSDGMVRADLVPLTRSTLLRISTVLIGLDIDDKPESLAILASYLDYILVGTGLEWITGDLNEVLPVVLEYKRRYALEFVEPAVARRRQLIASWREGALDRKDLPLDVITLLLLHEEAIDDEALLRECILFLSASTRTTSSAVIHTISELNGWFDLHPNDWALRLDRDFLRRAGMEALRLHPPSPALIRNTTEDVALKTGRCIEAGHMVALDLVGANRDPEAFGADPDDFNPWRNAKTRQYGHAFGSGPHTCLGLPLVLGTYARDDDKVDGTLVRFLRAFYEAGIQSDPERPPQPAPTDQGGYETFPVQFEML